MSDLQAAVPSPSPGRTGRSEIRTILASARGLAADRALLREAAALTRSLCAHLQVLHSTLPRVDGVVTNVGNAFAPAHLAGSNSCLEGLPRERARLQLTAKQHFDEACAEGGLAAKGALDGSPSAEWILVEGLEADDLAEFGRSADLILVARPVNPEPASLGVAETALLDSGRPVLMLPLGAHLRLPGTVAIAWKNRPEAARAVLAAGPFIALAERVTVIAVAEERELRTESSAQRIGRNLLRHNAATSVLELERNSRATVDVLLEEAANQDATLLVMGGYGHSRAREVIFGGVTRAVFERAPLPVLIMH